MDTSMDIEYAALAAMAAAEQVGGLHPLWFIVGVLVVIALIVWLVRAIR